MSVSVSQSDSRKFRVFDRKLEEIHSIFYCYLEIYICYWKKLNNTV